MSARGAGGEPDTDQLLAALQDAAGPPPLPPLTLAEPAPSARRGPIGAGVGAVRRVLVRLLVPSLADLLSQLERDRHRQRAELQRLEQRVAELERAAGAGDRGPAG